MKKLILWKTKKHLSTLPHMQGLIDPSQIESITIRIGIMPNYYIRIIFKSGKEIELEETDKNTAISNYENI